MNIKNKIQLSCAVFLSKYGSLYLYDEDLEKRFIIDHEQLKFNKNARWDLIGIPKKPDGALSDHEYFCIHDDIFDIINQLIKIEISYRSFLSNEPNEKESQSEPTEIHDDRIQNKKRSTTKKSTKHTI